MGLKDIFMSGRDETSRDEDENEAARAFVEGGSRQSFPMKIPGSEGLVRAFSKKRGRTQGRDEKG